MFVYLWMDGGMRMEAHLHPEKKKSGKSWELK